MVRSGPSRRYYGAQRRARRCAFCGGCPRPRGPPRRFCSVVALWFLSVQALVGSGSRSGLGASFLWSLGASCRGASPVVGSSASVLALAALDVGPSQAADRAEVCWVCEVGVGRLADPGAGQLALSSASGWASVWSWVVVDWSVSRVTVSPWRAGKPGLLSLCCAVGVCRLRWWHQPGLLVGWMGVWRRVCGVRWWFWLCPWWA